MGSLIRMWLLENAVKSIFFKINIVILQYQIIKYLIYETIRDQRNSNNIGSC
jgi:hypothetical protein